MRVNFLASWRSRFFAWESCWVGSRKERREDRWEAGVWELGWFQDVHEKLEGQARALMTKQALRLYPSKARLLNE